MGDISIKNNPSPAAIECKRRVDFEFKRKGVITAVSSGMFYGTYTAFMMYAMMQGIWAEWDEQSRSWPALALVVAALGAATTDSCSALWALGIATFKGKLMDFFRCIKSKPGRVMIVAAMIGGPLASTAYVVGLQQAGSIVVPISALCPAIGAILGRILFKQPLNSRMILGILICFAASAMIGLSSMEPNEARPNMMLGLFFGFLAALGWGIEGCVGGYSSSMVDPEIGITIRQVTSSLSNLFILVPILCLWGDLNPVSMITSAFTDTQSIGWFMIAGLGAYFGFMLWYKGNSMCGAALGMSCNGAFSFWGPFFCWLIIGVIFGIDGWSMKPIAWVAAIVMVIGIFTIAMNPLDLFRKKNGADNNETA